MLGLVEAGSDGWASPVTLLALGAGAALLALFVRTKWRAAKPILRLRPLTHPTRNAANVARGLLDAGMYGMFFFLSQFLQDIQGYSPGVAFLPMPLTVFCASQLTSRVLIRRLPEWAVLGACLATAGLLLTTQLHAGTPYGQIVVSRVLVGAGMGSAFVSLTTDSLFEVSPADAGAASGLINVTQQLGPALGLAVLVSVFGGVTGHVQLGRLAASARSEAVAVHGLETVFWLAAAFTLAALAMVAWRAGRLGRAPSVVELEVCDVDRAA